MLASVVDHFTRRSNQSKDEVKLSRLKGYLPLLGPAQIDSEVAYFPMCTYSENLLVFVEMIFDDLPISLDFEPSII